MLIKKTPLTGTGEPLTRDAESAAFLWAPRLHLVTSLVTTESHLCTPLSDRHSWKAPLTAGRAHCTDTARPRAMEHTTRHRYLTGAEIASLSPPHLRATLRSHVTSLTRPACSRSPHQQLHCTAARTTALHLAGAATTCTSLTDRRTTDSHRTEAHPSVHGFRVQDRPRHFVCMCLPLRASEFRFTFVCRVPRVFARLVDSVAHTQPLKLLGNQSTVSFRRDH